MKSPVVRFIAALTLWALSAACVQAATVLRMNHQFPAAAAGSKIDQWFADAVADATGGDMAIKIYWANALGEPKENLTLLRNGAVDMAAMSAGYFPAELPFFSAPNSIPMALDNICQSSALMAAFMDRVPAFAEEADRNGVRPLFFHLLNPYLLVSREAITGMGDLKGKKIRTWGEDMPRLIDAAGGVPKTIFLPELYENLQRGVIDGAPFSLDLIVTYRLYEVAKHVTEIVLWEGPAWGVWISARTWGALTGAQRQVLMTAAHNARRRELALTAAAASTARRVLVDKGVVFHPFPPDDLRRWRQASPDFFSDWIDKMAVRGKREAAKETVRIWKTIRETTTCP